MSENNSSNGSFGSFLSKWPFSQNTSESIKDDSSNNNNNNLNTTERKNSWLWSSWKTPGVIKSNSNPKRKSANLSFTSASVIKEDIYSVNSNNNTVTTTNIAKFTSPLLEPTYNPTKQTKNQTQNPTASTKENQNNSKEDNLQEGNTNTEKDLKKEENIKEERITFLEQQPPSEEELFLEKLKKESEVISKYSFQTGETDLKKLEKFDKLLSSENIDLDLLKKLSWNGIPYEVRALTWKLLLGYVPLNKKRRVQTLERKRKEYYDLIPKIYDMEKDIKTTQQKKDFKQIELDMPRTIPASPIFKTEVIQNCLARILYIYSVRHPASGYVQGMNDLAVPFLLIFLSDSLETPLEDCNPSFLKIEILNQVEADTYWCLTKLLDSIQDNFTFAQPGIQKMVFKTSELIKRIDQNLYEYIVNTCEIPFIQFAYTWMNCLFLRELPLTLVIRIWDTYFSEGENFPTFHVYTCASFLASFSSEIPNLDFQDLMFLLKTPPTQNWTLQNIEMMLSQAYVWKSMYESSPNQLSK